MGELTQPTMSVIVGVGPRRAETTGLSPIKSTIKSRHPDIPGNFGRAWPVFIFHEIRSCSTSPVGIFKFFFLNFRIETVLDAVSVEQLLQQGCGVGPGNARNGNQLQQLMDSSDSW